MSLLLCCTSWGVWAQTVVSAQFRYATGPEPQWVLPYHVAQTRVERGQDNAIGYLLVDKEIRVEGGRETVFRRMALTPLRQDGLSDAAQHEVLFNPEYQTLTIHRLAIHRDGRVLDKRDSGTIRLLQRETEMEQQLYVGTVSAMIVLDDVRVGDVVEFSYSIEGTNPVFGARHFSSHNLAWGVPVQRVIRRVLMPADRPLQVRTYNGAPPPRIRISGRVREYLWDLHDVSAYVDEGQYPQWYIPQPWAQVSEYRDWEAVRDWALALYRWNGQLDPQLLAKVRDWRALDDREAAIGQALAFVQRDIRYFGVEMGQNSHRPGDPNAIYARRYGDCKDKAQLLIALLRELGVEARPALVSTAFHRAIGDWLPSPGLFDHVIVSATWNGKRYWLDATRNFQDGSLEAVSTPEYGMALVVDAQGTPLVGMRNPPPQQASLEVEEEFVVVAYDQPVQFLVETVYRGAEAEYLRQRLSRTTRDELSRQYLNYYARLYPGIERVRQLQIHPDGNGSDLRLLEHYRIPDFWEREQGKLYFSLCGNTIQGYTSLPSTVRRHSPLALQFPVHVRHASILRLPDVDQFDVGKQPDLTVEDDAIRYRQHAAFQSRRLSVEHDYVSKADAVATAHVNDHIAKLRRINDSLCFSGWVSAPDAKQRVSTSERSSNPFAVLEQAVNGADR